MRLWCLVLLLVCPLPALASDLICWQTGQPIRYLASKDAGSVTDPTCTVVPKAQTQAQRDLIGSVQAQFPAVLHANTPLRYMVVEDVTLDGQATRLLRAMTGTETTGEIGQVNQAVDLEVAARQAYQDETATNTLCNATAMAQINARLKQSRDTLVDSLNASRDTRQASIDGIATANLAALKQGLTGLNQGMTADQVTAADTLYQVSQQLARCVTALQGTRR